ncbi:MAG: flagellar biosynthetic protein FliO [Deltaproteobacteria bacterium]
MKLRTAGRVAALSLGVIALTPEASAQTTGNAVEPPATTTPLALRRPHPLHLAPAPSPGLGIWKLALVGLVGGAVYWLARRRNLLAAASTPRETCDVVHRIHLGGRGEVVIVRVEGQLLALGVTPYSIQTLAALDAPEPVEAGDPVSRGATLGPSYDDMPRDVPTRDAPSGAASILDRARVAQVLDGLRPVRELTKPRRTEDTGHREPVEEQARGLIALRGTR